MMKHNSQFDRIRDCVTTCVARSPAPAFPTLSTTVSCPSQVCPTLDTRWLAAFHKTWKALLVPSASPCGARLPFHCPLDCSAQCQRCSICQQTQHVVQVCPACRVVWSHRILPDLLVLLAGRSHQLTHSWCHRCAVRSHCERPRCPIRLATELTRIHVCFCQEICVACA